MLLDVVFVLQIALTEVKIQEFLVKKLVMGEEWGFLFNAEKKKFTTMVYVIHPAMKDMIRMVQYVGDNVLKAMLAVGLYVH